MQLHEFDYHLPKELIAQTPLKERDQSKFLVLNRTTGELTHRRFFELPDLLDANTVLVLNESRVIPARLTFELGNGMAEILLIRALSHSRWECMVKPGAKFQVGDTIDLDEDLTVDIVDILSNGLRVIEFHCDDFDAYLKQKGQMPTPPYIKETLKDKERYQTIYSHTEGSVAAPTAGLHFTDRVFEALKQKGVQIEKVTLHVGLGTFQSVKTERIEDHPMHSEWFELKPEVAERLNAAKKADKRIVAVGTTSVRVLESCSTDDGFLQAQADDTNLYIYPGYHWKFVDGMITNFHVPKSSLMMLVSSLATPKDATDKMAGRDLILKAYEEAKKQGYRFFSFGDAMMIV
ncbi:tRNA preQ1(34) S-adenosylmethionine ribosyltransferase-isomerase QueA [Candidatus Peregrinibacteria bacterium]|nr:MAG: tRNA preQ1(34) S-adenosylmethionine ribosyltransferase-isomerase QueA [Candidatus Peregrinibacteria bacterium]